MQRWLWVVLGAMAVWLLDAPALLAAEGAAQWPALEFTRGPGAYLSPWKILITWLVFLCWVRTTDWMSQDAQLMRLRWAMWTPIAFFSFFLALLLLWVLPWFAVGIVLLLLAYIVPLVVYIVQRNNQVPLHEKVLTPKHLRRWLAQKVAVVGIKMEGAEIDPRDMGPQIKLTPLGGATDRDNTVNLLTARQNPGWTPSREFLDEALLQRATHVMLDFTPDAVAVRYQIDGVWHDRAPIDRATGDSILAVYKGLAALKIDDRRSRQSGAFGMDVVKEKYTCKVTSQGTQTGERALLVIESKKLLFKSLEELGMRTKMQEQFDEILNQPQGLIVYSALPGGGLSTTIDVVISHTDRFVRNFVTVVDIKKPEREIENLHATTYDSSAGETPVTVLPKLIRTYPDVILVRDVADLETLTILCDQAGDKRIIMTSVRAKEAVEALLRLLLLKIPPAEFAAAVTAVLNVRLIRKLCDKCKEAYPPPPEVLKQLGLPVGRIEALYRPPTVPAEGKADAICEQCLGIGYFGRTAIFELLAVDDGLRQVLVSTPKLENLRAAARKAKHRNLQEEGVLLVARGVTSLQELLRVLKQ